MTEAARATPGRPRTMTAVVQDEGCDGVIAPQPQDPKAGSGMGLNLVETLSQRWGVIRPPGGPTRVWAQLPCHRALA